MFSIYHILRELAANAAMSIAPVRSWRVRRGRTSGGDMIASALSSQDQAKFLLGSVGQDWIRERVVAEVGPGDAIPLALTFLGAGAKQYVAIDRFPGAVDSPLARAAYSKLLESFPAAFSRRLTEYGLLPLDDTWLRRAIATSRVKVVSIPIENATIGQTGALDLIVSYNVVEHLLDVDTAFRRMAALLAPGGCMVHRVDYGPHGCWKACDNPLAFLTIPELPWRMMGSARGYPNRLRHSEVMAALAREGFRSDCRIVTRFPLRIVHSIRAGLPSRLRRLDDEDLTVSCVEITSHI